MDSKINNKKIVCLGGGIGTVNLVKGLRTLSEEISIIVSGADDGGSSGRLRRLYRIFPPGDAVSCMSALSISKDTEKILTFRFEGQRYTTANKIDGHKLGNLIYVAFSKNSKSTQEALDKMREFFSIKGRVLPATDKAINLSAVTAEGKTIKSEEKIDLGLYKGKRILKHIQISPSDPAVPRETEDAIKNSDILFLGPGDLYTTLLPVVVVPKIKKALIESRAKKYFIVNVANKPFETSGYSVSDFINAIKNHLGVFPFEYVVINNNHNYKIPVELNYKFVKFGALDNSDYKFLSSDLVDKNFPLYHDPNKLAKLILENI